MKEIEYYKLIKDSKYQKEGKDVDFTVIVDTVDKKIRLIFAESNSDLDWKHNFQFTIKLYKHQKNRFYVANGWGNAYTSANLEIIKKLTEKINTYPYFELEVLGFSFGGAMAVLAAEDIYYRLNIKSNLITFGCPKVLFGKKSKKYFESCCNSIKQYAHVNDIVTYCPPFLGYTNLNVIRLGEKRSLKDLFNPYKYHQIYGDESLYNKR